MAYPGISSCDDRPLDSAGNPWSVSGLAWKILNPLVSGLIVAVGGITVTVSGLTVSVSGLENINRSGFQGVWTRLDTKIVQERSGFSNIWNGLNDVEREVIELQVINRSGFRDIETDLERLVGINHSGFDIKIRQEASGFGNTWSGLREVETTLNAIQVINTNIQSGVAQLRQGETLILSTRGSISGTVSGQLGCYNRWTLYLASSGANSVTLELTPDVAPPYFWFEPSESPVSVPSGGFSVNELGYDATYIRLTGNSGWGTTVRVRGCW